MSQPEPRQANGHLSCPMAPGCSATFSSTDDQQVHLLVAHADIFGDTSVDQSGNGPSSDGPYRSVRSRESSSSSSSLYSPKGATISCKGKYQKSGNSQMAEIRTTLKSSLEQVREAFEAKERLAKGSIRMFIYKGKTIKATEMTSKTLEGIEYKDGDVLQIFAQ